MATSQRLGVHPLHTRLLLVGFPLAAAVAGTHACGGAVLSTIGLFTRFGRGSSSQSKWPGRWPARCSPLCRGNRRNHDDEYRHELRARIWCGQAREAGIASRGSGSARTRSINRTPPQTQAAPAEATAERQVSVDGEARPTSRPSSCRPATIPSAARHQSEWRGWPSAGYSRSAGCTYSPRPH